MKLSPVKRSKKTTARTFWHVCPIERVEKILTNGIRPRAEVDALWDKDGILPDHVYLYSMRDRAEQYREYLLEEGLCTDTAVIEISGIDHTNLTIDHETVSLRLWLSPGRILGCVDKTACAELQNFIVTSGLDAKFNITIDNYKEVEPFNSCAAGGKSFHLLTEHTRHQLRDLALGDNRIDGRLMHRGSISPTALSVEA